MVYNDLEDGDVVIDLCSVFLSYTLGDPDDIAALLLLEFQVRIENAKVELLHKSVHVQFDLKIKKINFQIQF